MKIMREESWVLAVAGRAGSVMLVKAEMGRSIEGEYDMRWETPQAVDLRFGMEITMYIANR